MLLIQPRLLRRVIRFATVGVGCLALAGASAASPTKRQTDLIAYVSTATGGPQAYTVQADGSNLRQLTSDESNVGSPVWSPDGTRLLVPFGCTFGCATPSPSRFATMRPDGSDRVDLLGRDPVFSPDGKWLAYLVCATTCDVMVAHANGRAPILVDRAAASSSFVWSPWSSDGKKLVYAKPGAASSSIWIADRTGHQKRAAITVPEEVSTPVFFPGDGTITWSQGFPARAWSLRIGETQPTFVRTLNEAAWFVPSPTRARLGVQELNIGPGGSIGVFDQAFGYVPVQRNSATELRWSPDGTRIAYTYCDRSYTMFPGGPCSFRIGDAGGPQTTVVNGPASERTPWLRGYDWAPDGTRLVIAISAQGGPHRLMTVNQDGSDIRPLLSGSDDQYAPAWQPEDD